MSESESTEPTGIDSIRMVPTGDELKGLQRVFPIRITGDAEGMTELLANLDRGGLSPFPAEKARVAVSEESLVHLLPDFLRPGEGSLIKRGRLPTAGGDQSAWAMRLSQIKNDDGTDSGRFALEIGYHPDGVTLSQQEDGQPSWTPAVLNRRKVAGMVIEKFGQATREGTAGRLTNNMLTGKWQDLARKQLGYEG